MLVELCIVTKFCNSTSSNWKAGWARFTKKSRAQVMGSNLTEAKVNSH